MSPLGECICCGVIVPVVACCVEFVETTGEAVFGARRVDSVRPVEMAVLFVSIGMCGGSAGGGPGGCDWLESTASLRVDRVLSVFVGVRLCLFGGPCGGG